MVRSRAASVLAAWVMRSILMLALPLSSSSCSRDGAAAAREAVPGVRLGMAPRDVRDRFQPGTEGTWQTALGAGDDTVLEWTARVPAPKPSMVTARFEFHLAMLVAVRARTGEPPPESDRIGLTAKTVTVRSPAREGGTAITVLARDCPTHKDEAESFASRAK
jgi:hypothetical protein